MIKLSEIFWTFQGEGEFSGQAALFVRVPNCNLDCSWCDTDWKTWKEYSEEQFKEICREREPRFAVLTGGEPMLNPQSKRIIKILKEEGFFIATETNGTAPILDGVDHVVVSPKEDSKRLGKEPYYICEDALNNADEVKIVVEDESSFDMAKMVYDRFEDAILKGRRYNGLPVFWLSPEATDMKEWTDKIVEKILSDKELGSFKLNLQTHKLVGWR